MIGPPRLFVYGTLQPGRLRWPHLAPFATGHRPATVRGRIYDSGHGWPVAVLDDADAAGDRVLGVLVELDVDRVTTAIDVIDDVERTATDILRRIVVTTLEGDDAWAYHCVLPTDGMTRIDHWDRDDEQ